MSIRQIYWVLIMIIAMGFLISIAIQTDTLNWLGIFTGFVIALAITKRN